ncbi:MAG TPA: hypothetical protein VJQ54_14870 [Candidatus Sulfotelmatobacter sp.]|nr:hypothetical protein [Candidatus Sulfotelmatobacter sp.]
MKVGAENKKELYAMLALMVIAVVFLVRMFLSYASPTPGVAASVSNTLPAQPEGANQHGTGRAKSTAPLDPTLRTDLLKNSEGAEYKGSGRNIFEAQATPPPIIQPTHTVVNNKGPIGPPLPPPPPPIPLKFFGFANKPGEPKSIFLANGDAVFIGREGDIVNRRYKILHIQSNQVEIEDVLNNNRQTIPLTQG